MSISVKSVTKVYGEQHALNDVSFEIGKGEIIGFLGPNGAGKSTMMKIITCFIPQSNGEVKVCGFDVEKDPLQVKEQIGYLPEHNPLYLEMYVKEYLLFVAGLYKVKNAKERVAEMIELVGLTIEQKKKMGALSKGYRQRVGLAQALIHDPEVLILDEPTTGLDPNQIVEIRNLIKKIGQEKTVMMSTHIMQEVEAICDRVIIINKGKIVADQPTSELNALLDKELVLRVEFSEDVEIKELKKLNHVTQVIPVNKSTFELLTSGEDIRGEVFEFAVNKKLKVLEMHQEERGLEDVFQHLTR